MPSRNMEAPRTAVGGSREKLEKFRSQDNSKCDSAQTPQAENDGSFATFTFDPTVRVNKEIPSYNWFNFIVDIGKK